jgi:hypothetical protein
MFKRFIPLLIAACCVVLALGFAVSVPMSAAGNNENTVVNQEVPTLAPTRARSSTAIPNNTTTTGASTGEPSTVQYLVVTCGNQMVFNLSGSMGANFDLFVQGFNAAGGGGAAITPLQQISVSGAYQVSVTVPYNSGVTVAQGGIASARITIARESNSARSIFSTTVDDINDGCAAPQFAAAQTSSTGGTLGGGAQAQGTPLAAIQATNPATGLQNITGTGSGIQSPRGGFLNPTYVQQPAVVLGPRTSDIARRNQDAGLVFAECNNYWPAADPGLLYDTDDITVFWSWFARTPAQIQQHIDNVRYSIVMNGRIFDTVAVSQPQIINNDNWIFYTAPVGRLAPGWYGIEYIVNWNTSISDGYDSFGPGTANVSLIATCSFEVRPNPQGVGVATNPSYTPWRTPTIWGRPYIR